MLWNVIKYILFYIHGESNHGPQEQWRKRKGSGWWGCVWAMLLTQLGSPGFSGGENPKKAFIRSTRSLDLRKHPIWRRKRTNRHCGWLWGVDPWLESGSAKPENGIGGHGDALGCSGAEDAEPPAGTECSPWWLSPPEVSGEHRLWCPGAPLAAAWGVTVGSCVTSVLRTS